MTLSPRNSTWIISDTHFGHKNIIKFQQRPETHEEIMLSNWIERVGEDDVILHLGDVFLGKDGNPLRWASIISRMPGRKYLIPGNHDKQKRRLYEEVAGFQVIRPFIHNGIAYTHRPISSDFPVFHDEWDSNDTLVDWFRLHDTVRDAKAREGWHTNVHGHIHGNSLNWSADLYDEPSPFADKLYVNACVEVNDFAPIQLGNLLPKAIAGDHA